MATRAEYLIGVDGGGTGTRVCVCDPSGLELARASGGPSGLAHGIGAAWQTIEQTLSRAFTLAERAMPDYTSMAIGLGLAGVHNKQWAAQFVAHNPGFASIALETDAYTTLLGAHQGRAGAIVAVGTGTVGEALFPNGLRKEVSGWGFPCGDEASGAWLGLQAVNHLQRVYDGRAVAGPLALALKSRCGDTRDALQIWLGAANQTTYAQLAPLVLDAAPTDDFAADCMRRGAAEIASVADALDPSHELPLALCGGLVQSYFPYLPQTLQSRVVDARADSAAGAVWLVRQHA